MLFVLKATPDFDNAPTVGTAKNIAITSSIDASYNDEVIELIVALLLSVTLERNLERIQSFGVGEKDMRNSLHVIVDQQI